MRFSSSFFFLRLLSLTVSLRTVGGVHPTDVKEQNTPAETMGLNFFGENGEITLPQNQNDNQNGNQRDQPQNPQSFLGVSTPGIRTSSVGAYNLGYVRGSGNFAETVCNVCMCIIFLAVLMFCLGAVLESCCPGAGKYFGYYSASTDERYRREEGRYRNRRYYDSEYSDRDSRDSRDGRGRGRDSRDGRDRITTGPDSRAYDSYYDRRDREPRRYDSYASRDAPRSAPRSRSKEYRPRESRSRDRAAVAPPRSLGYKQTDRAPPRSNRPESRGPPRPVSPPSKDYKGDGRRFEFDDYNNNDAFRPVKPPPPMNVDSFVGSGRERSPVFDTKRGQSPPGSGDYRVVEKMSGSGGSGSRDANNLGSGSQDSRGTGSPNRTGSGGSGGRPRGSPQSNTMAPASPINLRPISREEANAPEQDSPQGQNLARHNHGIDIPPRLSPPQQERTERTSVRVHRPRHTNSQVTNPTFSWYPVAKQVIPKSLSEEVIIPDAKTLITPQGAEEKHIALPSGSSSSSRRTASPEPSPPKGGPNVFQQQWEGKDTGSPVQRTVDIKHKVWGW